VEWKLVNLDDIIGGDCRLNRTKVEWKQFLPRGSVIILFSLNRTKVEWKHNVNAYHERQAYRLNRTKVEWKHQDLPMRLF